MTRHLRVLKNVFWIKTLIEMLNLCDIDFFYPSDEKRQSKILESINLQFQKGHISVIVGPSGCGKTTLLNLVAGLLEPTSGTIHFPRELPNSCSRAGYVFQTPSLLPWRTIRQNALFGAEIINHLCPKTEQKCNRLLESYGLSGFEEVFPSSLSGGMQQRVSIIRAVVSGAKIMLLDEPFSNTDFVMRRELQIELSRLVSEEQLIAILVTHDIEEAVRIGDKVIVLSQRPARVKSEIEIPMSREERLKNTGALIQYLATFVERVENVFRSSSSETKPIQERKEIV